MPYHYLNEVATADIAFEAYGESKEEMFIAAADALMNVMVEDLGTIKERVWREVSAEAENAEMLLFRFLQEFIYYKDAEQLLLRAARLRFKEQNGAWTVTARAYGETLDPQKHPLNVDVKAVTMHQFAVSEHQGQWKARVVLDI
ncbi:MAG: archease [Candidatus Omnitrophica bacterium]|nr:archease [Candidatus Omnitrophota bacterium]